MGAAMRVLKVLDPVSNAVSYTVVGEAGVVEPAERYLRYLTETERSPNTIKAHAHDLKDWFVFLDEYGLDWQSVTLEDVGAFIRWLRRPPDMRGQVFSVLPAIGHHCGEATVNRKLSTVSIFYQHAARHGLDLRRLRKTTVGLLFVHMRLTRVTSSSNLRLASSSQIVRRSVARVRLGFKSVRWGRTGTSFWTLS